MAFLNCHANIFHKSLNLEQSIILVQKNSDMIEQVNGHAQLSLEQEFYLTKFPYL